MSGQDSSRQADGTEGSTGDEQHEGARADTLWTTFFPYDEPYAQQRTGIQSVLSQGQQGGYTLLEGACGTGKTLLALTSGLALVRDPRTKYTDILVLTSVKQQLRAFEEDLRTINRNLSEGDSSSGQPETDAQREPVQSTTLVGKADVCPYVASGAIDRDNIYVECSNLRSNTRGIINNSAGDRVAVASDIRETGNGSESGIGSDATDRSGEFEHTIDVEGAAFGPDVPEYGDTSVCPYYSQTKVDEFLDERSIKTDGEILSPERLTEKAVQFGACPHSSMQKSVSDADVVLGNYSHAFDSTTVKFLTNQLLDESTFLICDEAHMLIDRVREQSSHRVSLQDVTYALEDTDAVLEAFSGEARRGRKEAVTDAFGGTPHGRDSVTEFRRLLAGIHDAVLERVDMYIEREYDGELPDGIGGNVEHVPLESIDVPEDEEVEVDDLTKWLRATEFNTDLLETASEIAELINDALLAFPDPPGHGGMSSVLDVGQLMTSWHHADSKRNFREIKLDSYKDAPWNPDRPWQDEYATLLCLENCIPMSRIESRLDDFGGGVLMSATLTPMDVFEREAGIQFLRRPVEREVFGLSFPPENRRSLIVPATKFTSTNRGEGYRGEDAADKSKMTSTRRTYARVIRDVVETTPGNVLVAMPNYAEAQWAADFLRNTDAVSKDVLEDASSTNDETNQLKEAFFNGDDKVLATSMLGTLTEGVDYTGDRLRGAVICGVPLKPSQPAPMAARAAAYERELGAGHPFAFSVPAVRKARQALGRVIRGGDEHGVRVLVDQRYAGDCNGSIRHFFPEHVADEFDTVGKSAVRGELESFWGNHDI
jgi:DNA excision repair protein ERCC-2